ncbi:hypothetical protein B7463_g11830, partial [Scytalidium lignicola]
MTTTIKEQLQEAMQWYFDNQKDLNDRATVVATACIFKLKVNTLRKAIRRESTTRKARNLGGRPSFLKPHQIEVLNAYIRKQAYDGNLLNRAMVIRAATHLNGNGEEPSMAWLRRFIQGNPAFHIITTKPIEKE